MKKAYYRESVPVPGTHAQLLKRPDSAAWYCLLTIPGVETPRPRSTRKTDLGEAMAVARRMNAEAVRKVHREEPLTEPLIKTLLNEFMAYMIVEKPDREIHRIHESASRNHILRLLGDRTLSSLTEKDSLEYKQTRRREGAKVSTIARELNTLRWWAKFGIKKKFRKERLRAPIEQQKPEETDNSYFGVEECILLRRILRHEDPVLFNLALFMFYSGCRVVEVKNLKFEHVYHWRLKNNNMTVRVRLQGKQKVRVVPMPPVVRAIIDRMEKMYGRREGFIFPNMSKLAERFRDILIVEGMYVDEEGNHRELGSFRHTRATFELLRERVSREVLAKWMGHTVREQEHTYSKILDAIKHEQMFKVKGGKGR